MIKIVRIFCGCLCVCMALAIVQPQSGQCSGRLMEDGKGGWLFFYTNGAMAQIRKLQNKPATYKIWDSQGNTFTCTSTDQEGWSITPHPSSAVTLEHTLDILEHRPVPTAHPDGLGGWRLQ